MRNSANPVLLLGLVGNSHLPRALDSGKMEGRGRGYCQEGVSVPEGRLPGSHATPEQPLYQHLVSERAHTHFSRGTCHLSVLNLANE